MGLGIDAADLKSQDFDTTFNQLTATFGQFAENEAETTTKQMERVKIALCNLAKAPMAVILKLVITALDPALLTICLKSEMRPPKIAT